MLNSGAVTMTGSLFKLRCGLRLNNEDLEMNVLLEARRVKILCDELAVRKGKKRVDAAVMLAIDNSILKLVV